MRLTVHIALIILILSMGLALNSDYAHAVEFAIVGPRAMGMGGAGVAVTTDALAAYWNPAGLAMEKTVDIRGQVSGQLTDRLGVADTLDEIDSINQSDTSPANQARLQALLNKLARPGTSLYGAAAGGLYLKGYVGDHALALSISDVATGGAFFPIVDTTVTQSGGQLQNNTQQAMKALEARQAALSYAAAFLDRTVAIGATVKLIQGAAYANQVNVFSAEGDVKFTEDLGEAKLSTAWSVDAGLMFRPTSWLRLGVVGKDLTEPSFDAPNGETFKLVPQVRGGVAVNPYPSLTLTFDGDITSNKTLVPGIKSQLLSVGAEQLLLSDVLALRIGALKNVKDAEIGIMPTAGLGIRLFALRVDVGGGYDFRERQAMASASVALTF
jgi:hypothetical protein